MPPAAYDPQAHGAQCAACYLLCRREGPPVGPEHNAGATAILVGEAPKSTDCEIGRPFVDEAGRELMHALNAAGLQRGHVSFTNALACRPPGNELPRLYASLNATNKDRKKRSLELLPDPLVCCRPRLFQELAQYSNIVVMGRTAIKAVLSDIRSIFDLRGGPVEGWLDDALGFIKHAALAPASARAVKVLPTIHPSLVLHQRRWQRVFRADIGRAFRWFQDKRAWKDPEVLIQPTPVQVKTFLARPEKFFAFDFETEMANPLEARIFCIGIGTAESVIVIPFLSKERYPEEYYTPSQREEILYYLRAFFTDTSKVHVGHNSLDFDRIIMKARWGFEPVNHWDTLVLHRSVESELPHTLYFVGTTYTDVHAWKADHAGTNAQSDNELFVYNGIDVAVTARVVDPLIQAVKARGQSNVAKKDHKVLDICAGLRVMGMKVDPVKRDFYDHKFLGEYLKYRQVCRDALGIMSFNPNSVVQVADVLFERWRLPPVQISEKTGAPSTGDDTLREYRLNHPLDKNQKTFIEALRRCRLYSKLRGTEVIRFRRPDEAFPADDHWSVEELGFEEDRAFCDDVRVRKKKDEEKKALLLKDGRCHASWNQLTVSGRLSCNKPNLMNRKGKYRDMFIPEGNCPYCKEPHVFVGADSDQLELRFNAAWWDMKVYLSVLAEGRDPHAETAVACMGAEAAATLARAQVWAKSQLPKIVEPKKYPDWARMRDFAKVFFYGCCYKAEDETVHNILTSTEDDEGRLVFASITRSMTAERRRNLLESNPEFEVGWARDIKYYRDNGCIVEPVWGRRRDCLDGESANEIVNFPAQSGGVAVIHEATFRLIAEIPFQKWCPTSGLVNQCHDALVVEVPRSKGEWTRRLLQECMTVDGRPYGLDMTFTAGAKIGNNWKEVK